MARSRVQKEGALLQQQPGHPMCVGKGVGKPALGGPLFCRSGGVFSPHNSIGNVWGVQPWRQEPGWVRRPKIHLPVGPDRVFVGENSRVAAHDQSQMVAGGMFLPCAGL